MRTSRYYRIVAVLMVMVCFGVGLSIAPPRAQALDFGLGDILKLGGITWVVSHYGDQIDSAINGLLRQRGIEAEGRTKVVPVLRVGGGSAIGAAQVVGPARQVDKVKAVGEIQVSALGRLRARALVPIESKNVVQDVKGVGGVGTSATIQLRF